MLDDYFSPDELKIKKDTKVKFKWDKSNLNTHNVTFKKGPKGVKKSKKPCAEGQDHQVQRLGHRLDRDQLRADLQQEGHYSFVCTIHPTVMKMKVKVKK